MTRRTRPQHFRPSSRCARPRTHRTSSSCCWMTSALARPVPLVVPAPRRLQNGSPRMAWKYTRFHTTALCAPTRAALLSGRNHHAVGMGTITELATSAPGYTSIRPNTAAPLAEILKLNGYSTAYFGKCHEVPVWETSPMGPFDLADGWGRVRAFLWLPRWRDEPVRTGPVRRHDAGRAAEVARRGLPPDRGPDRPGHLLDPPAEGADVRQTLLRLLRARRDARASPRPEGMGRQVQGQVRPGLGCDPRGDVRPSEGARRHPAGRPADAPSR